MRLGKIATDWAGKEDWINKRKKHYALEDKTSFVTFTLDSVKPSTEHVSTSTGVGNKSITKTLGRGKIFHVETRQRGASNNVMLMASLDNKTACDEARPRHSAKIMESCDVHGWLIAAVLRERSGLDVRMCRKLFHFQSMSAPTKRRSSKIVAKDGDGVPGQCGGELGKEKKWASVWTCKGKGHIRCAALCGPTTSGSCPTPKFIWNRFCGI